MFVHSFIYELRQLFRQKPVLYWNLLFPIVLSTLFYIGFSGLSSGETFSAIPVAVVLENTDTDTSLKDILDSLNAPGEETLLDIVYTTQEEALSLLEQEEIIGILHEASPVTLSVSSGMSNKQLEQSILASFTEQFTLQYGALAQIAREHPENSDQAMKLLMQDTRYNTETSFADGDMDQKISYFFNLIAMSCLFASMSGVQLAIRNQANLSPIGARRGISPVPKFISLFGALCATFLFQFLCVGVGLIYITVFLKINFGKEMGYVLFTTLLGCITGVSYGFCIGCVSHISESVKSGLQMAVTMVLCFLSGLMVGNIRILIEKICPWWNRINPAALISDSFYALTVYQSHHRYFINSATLLALSALFCFAGFLLVRREKYAAL